MIRLRTIGAILLTSALLAYSIYPEIGIWRLQANYKRKFRIGTPRDEIKNRLLLEGIRFWENTPSWLEEQKGPFEPDAISVSLGNEARFNLFCSSREVWLVLEFQQTDIHHKNQGLRKTHLVRSDGACL